MRLVPAEADSGIVFQRTDLPDAPPIPARYDLVIDTRLCTVIGHDDINKVGTIEHLMAALAGCGVDNLRIEVDGPELPVMDGSAEPFVFLIDCAGMVPLGVPGHVIRVLKPVTVIDGERSATLYPSDESSVGFEIDFASDLIGHQSRLTALDARTFRTELARARTFGFAEEVEAMRAAGLARGGSLDNAVVVDGGRILNPEGLRYADEFVRHKILDAAGDLYLAGARILGHYHGRRAGHGMTNRLLRTLFTTEGAYEIVSTSETRKPAAAQRRWEEATPLAATA